MKWSWETVDPARSGSAGDLAKLFKNEGVKQPGHLSIGAPSVDATLIAREVIQNSWDAARELQHRLRASSKAAPPFHLEFRFRSLTDSSKRKFASAVGLSELSKRARSQDRATLGLDDFDCLDALSERTPLEVLEISEFGTTGMDGPFVGTRSKLYLALVSIGFTNKELGAGGSYGYGKAGLIRGSAIRTIVAYTCFSERSDDPAVTRRLMGMTYWGPHEIKGVMNTGFARFGHPLQSGAVVPFENDLADRRAEDLGMPLRSPDNTDQLGSTFLLIQPTVTPEDLCTAIERSWWPALTDQLFTIDIITSENDRLIPRPKKDPLLGTFIRSYELATVPQDNAVSQERSKSLKSAKVDGERRELGRLGLLANTEGSGWSYPIGSPTFGDEGGDEGFEQRSLVALTRGPRMVVEYLDVGRTMPFVRGTFVASDSMDDLLRQTEPKAHDSWDSAPSVDGIDPKGPKAASEIVRLIRYQVNDLRKALRPPTPVTGKVQLPVLESLFRGVLMGTPSTSDQTSAESEPLLISIDQILEPGDSTETICLTATVTVRLGALERDESFKAIELSIRCYFIEDGRSTDKCPLTISAPQGFREIKGRQMYEGNLGTDPAVFAIRSAPYDSDWTCRLEVVGSPKDESRTPAQIRPGTRAS